MKKNTYFVYGAVLLAVILLVILILPDSNEENSEVDSEVDSNSAPEVEGDSEEIPADWKEVKLKNVLTGETLKVNDFSGKTILIESFAVWCPTCTKQQEEMKNFHEGDGKDVISISLDTDPNEDEEKVLSHANKHGFDWIYVVSPTEVTQALIQEYGVGVINAPSVPIILICEDGNSRLLGRGLKDSAELTKEINNGC